ncbi:hypothetical protein M9Y10_031516 [Tritrichomonas musculus]|uniref:Uncharacterized protein n=1 Tax=Tritrichomonas musculus TaxID=1915356 RepID=A0ABR2H1S0_9EUKA
MEIQEYFQILRNIEEILIDFLDEENNSSIGFQEIIKANNLSAKKSDLIEILRLITKVANNHTRTPNFSSKIQEILLFLKDKIISNFSNSEIFQIFKSNKRILLFLYEEKILIPDQSIADILATSKFKQKKYISLSRIEIVL